MKEYYIMIHGRYLKWIDDKWYETTTEFSGLVFDSLTKVREIVAQLNKHYVYKNIAIMERDYSKNEDIEIQLYSKPLMGLKDKVRVNAVITF